MENMNEGEHHLAVSESKSPYECHTTKGEGESPRARRRRLLQQLGKVMRASLGMCLIGSLYTFPSVLLSDATRHNTTIYGNTISFDGRQDMISSLVLLGSLPGTWLTGFLSMKLGRRLSMMISGVLGVAGWLGTALLPSATGILVARFVSGLAVGGMSVAVNAYVAELSDPEVRGMMSMALNLAIMFGQLLTVSIGYNARYFLVALLNTIIPTAFIIFLIWMPESPSVLVLRGEEEAGLKVLLELRGRHADLKAEVKSYRDMNAASERAWRSLLLPPVLKSLAVISTLFFLSSFSGQLVITANASKIFEEAGTSLDGNLSAIIVMVVQIVSGICGFFLLDKLGRKKVLYIGFLLISVPLTVMATYVGKTQQASASDDEVEMAGGWLPLACLVVSQIGSSFGVTGVPFLLSQEYFPTAIRPQANSVTLTMWTVATFLVLQLHTTMVKGLTLAGLYGFYASVSALAIPFIAFCIRETMGENVG